VSVVLIGSLTAAAVQGRQGALLQIIITGRKENCPEPS